jgi:hypothetical protein
MNNNIDQIFEELENINNNFLNTKQEPKMKVELIEEVKYNETLYWLKIDVSYVGCFTTYEAAKQEFDKAVCFEPRQTVLESKEI